MAAPGLLLFLLLHQTFAELEVSAPATQRVLNGSSVVLPCTFSIAKLTFDPKYLAILWSFQQKQILVYDSKGLTRDPRVMLDVEAAKDGNASLTVAEATLSDAGTYSCLVVYSPERTEKDIVLEVQVRPVILLPNQTVRKERENSLRCTAVGFFPQDIDITWVLDGKIQNNSLMGEPVRNKDDTYNVTSFVTFTMRPTLETKTLSCTVRHASLHDPLQQELQLVYEEEAPAGIIAACCVIVVLLVVIIAGALWWKLRRKAKGPFTVRDIVGPSKLIDGEEAILYCTVDDNHENLSVTWLMRRAGQEQEIQTSQIREHSEEADSLLDTSYVIRSKQEGRQYETSLSFIPHIERHKGVSFICRGDSKEHKKEKTFHCQTVYGKPQLLQPVRRSLLVIGEVKYLLNLERFYPKNIKIVWTCGAETEEVVSFNNSVSDNPDGTYSVWSEVRIPEDRHKDPGFRVRVTWEHESMDEAGSRELSVRDEDYSWTPVVEEIQVPRLLHGSPAVLLCDISKYLPDNVTVTWWRRPEQSPELYEDPDAVTQIMTSRRAADNTYSCTARLTITPTLGTHQGAEYICKVEHPSLERPIEKSTGRLQVYAKPQMSSPIEISMVESSRIQFFLRLQTFYPKDINISWCWEDTSGKHELSAEQKLTTQDDYLTYDVTSAVWISVHAFNDREMKIIVGWKHEAMETPETRSITLKGLPLQPQVGSISVPELKGDTKAKLTCDISRYFPDLLSVSWFIKKNGNWTPLPKESSKVDKKKRQKDNTYSCEASVTFTPSMSLHQGSEIICRVEHPSLEDPIERSTGPLHIGEKKNFLEKLGLPIRRSVEPSSRNEEIEETEDVAQMMEPELVDKEKAPDT